ncbi:ABC transporter ATP-binding protein [Xanthobacter dioxanivorans]|uniref:ABC transporter ATP-binding protein n=1 Tax=Xanthobacter dioxanivorans TaxID=2528964 RepID=A0A974SHP5_9HYPH|nr:ABC transporter ATP-binding protein [Xanthobacter dioxanivorans]QRG05364.1 ABC transporter ATP-binding protein [Xanthobacter dioxanivorans]
MNAAALEISGLTKRFGGLVVTRDVSMRIAPGERRLIIGPNGAGKTTLFNQITGDLQPNSGCIRMFGEDITKLKTRHRVARGLARTYQILTLFPQETLLHNVVLSLLGLRLERWDPWRILANRSDLFDLAQDSLQQVGLGASGRRRVAETSYGERRRLELAMALAQKPKVLLLDEPLAGLSPEERNGVSELFAAIPRDVTIIMIEHDMDVALAFAEQITVLHFGQVIVEGTRSEVVSDPRTREIYLGE